MRRTSALFAALALAAHTVMSAPTELGLDVMQNIEDTNKDLASHIALRDGPAALGAAKNLDGLFAEVEAHFVARGDAANAVELTKKSRSLLTLITSASKAGDFTAATDAATDLSRTCRTCHTFYKKE